MRLSKLGPVELLVGPVKAPFSFITPLEATNTGPSFNQGSGDGARGCDFEERAGPYCIRAQRGIISYSCASMIFSLPRRGHIGTTKNAEHSGRYRPIRKTVPWSRTWLSRCQQPRGQLSVSSHRSSPGVAPN